MSSSLRARWKAAERRHARDLGVERIPVSGRTKDEPDFEDGFACYQIKQRKILPVWLWRWLLGIVHAGLRRGKIGALILSRPGQPRHDSLVVLRWKDWVDLHGTGKAESLD